MNESEFESELARRVSRALNKQSAISALVYLCRMLWLGRTDKLSATDIEFGVWLGKTYGNEYASDISPANIKYNAIQQFNVSHDTLARTLEQNLVTTFTKQNRTRLSNNILSSLRKRLFSDANYAN